MVTEAKRPSNRAFYLALFSLCLLHGLLLLYFAPPAVMFAKEPVMTVDYALHVYQVDRVSRAWAEHGALWGWDPLQLAGHPIGVMEDLTSKGTELWVIGLSALGVHKGFAFNLLILVVHLGLPVTAWVVGRLLRMSRWQTLSLHGLWLLLWFFDSFMHWCWWIGMISWAFTSYLGVLLIALLYRSLESAEDKWGWLRFIWLGLLAATIAIVHPFAVLSLIPAAILLYARSFKKLRKQDHALLWLAIAMGGSTILIWIFPFIKYIHYLGDADTFFNASPWFALFDSFDLLKDGRQTGGPVRTMVRMVCFVAAGLLLYRWHREKDGRALGFSALIIWALTIAYFGGLFWIARQTQPYRQIGPATMAAAVPAAILLSQVFSWEKIRSYSRSAQIAILLLVVAAAPRLVRTMLYYVPDGLPKLVERTERDFLLSPLVGLEEPKPDPMRHTSILPHYLQVRDWLNKHHRGYGRVVVADWVMAEYIATSSRIPTLGGLIERNIWHKDAHLFYRSPVGDMPQAELARYMDEYAVGYLVMGGKVRPIETYRQLWEPVTQIMGYRIYRAKKRPSYFAEGQGEVTDQRFNRVQLKNVSGESIVLRLHWHESLRCEPECQMERVPSDYDRVGFIRVLNPPPNFEIYNGY